MSSALDSRRAWFVWGVGVAVYTSAVLQRTSFGVAGVYATERFQAGASIVSLFVVVQLLTYAAMQIPVGVLSDRFGSRVVLAFGALLMTLGQIDLAYSQSLVSAVVARILVGAGDAMTFSAVIRTLPAWFSARRVPVLVQATAMVGQLGQLLSTIPLAAVLRTYGWTPAFVAAGSISALMLVLILTLLRDAPPGVRTTITGHGITVAQQVRDALRIPGTRLGFWIHMMSSVPTHAFAFMWGYPYLTAGLGYPPDLVSVMFLLFVLAGIPAGPLIGMMSRRAPLHRTTLAVTLAACSAASWLSVLLWPGEPPVWLVGVLMLVMAAAGPAAMVGIDVARSANPPDRVGTATGMVIVGGFLGGLVTIGLVGVVLDFKGGLSASAFDVAWLTQFVVVGVAVVCAYVERARARRLDVARGVRFPPVWRVARREWNTRRSGPDAGSGVGTAAGIALALEGGRTVRVAAVIPGDGGRLLAIDVPPAGATDEWWTDRITDHLELVASPTAQVGEIEIRVPDQQTAASVRRVVSDDLARRGAALPYTVVVR